MQHHPCDLMLVHEEVMQRDGDQGLAWLRQGRDTPLLFLAADKPHSFAQAYQDGADMCLVHDMVLRSPLVLAAALERAGSQLEKQRAHMRIHKQLLQCRRHVDRLVNLIWRATPVDAENQWCTQRYAMERLQEETARTKRHGGPFTLAVGEVQADPEGTDGVAEWMAKTITQAKRRCDVAGQYGMRGFVLLMVMTPKSGGMICCRRLQRLLQGLTDSAKGPRGPVRAHFGLASASPENCLPQTLLRLADQNLEMAKAGRNEGVVAEGI
jgi:diguanylate cyclase (GGDEF)-like protein